MSDPLYKVGTVIDWGGGRRSVIGSHQSGIYRMNDVDSGTSTYVDEGFILLNSYPTMVQPGQVYQSAVHRYKVLAPLASDNWLCSVPDVEGLPVDINESLLLSWIVIEGLDAEPPRQHGPHTCPRCGQGGALIMAIRTVHCTNSSCPCYSKP